MVNDSTGYQPVQGSRSRTEGKETSGIMLQDRSYRPSGSSSSSTAHSASSSSSSNLLSTSTVPKRNSYSHSLSSFAASRPMLHAAIKAGMLFVLSTAFMAALLWVMLPTLDDAHKDMLKLPKNFEDLKELNGVLQVSRYSSPWWRETDGGGDRYTRRGIGGECWVLT